jgi:hypothetical protein
MMAFTEVDPDDEYMEDMLIANEMRLADPEPCWYTLKATGKEIIEHFQEGHLDRLNPSLEIPHGYEGHPFWCGPCEGYNVLGLWFDCNLHHQMEHRFLWELDQYVQ